MLNTPVMELYEPQFPMSAIPESDQLILKFQSENGGEKNDRGTLFSAMADKFVGVRYSARDAQEADGIKAFASKTVTVPLKTEKGDFSGALQGTVNFSMPIEHKNHLQQKLQIEVDHYLRRRGDSETYTFNSISGALLALDDQLFDAAAIELQDNVDSAAVISFRQHAQQALSDLKYALIDAKATTKDMLTLTTEMRKAMATLDQLGDVPGKIDWLAKKLNHRNDPDYIELLQAVKRMDAGATGPKSVVMTEAIKEMGLRDIVTKSENFIREVIFPSLYRLRQPDANVKLLNQAIADLREARSDKDYNDVLNRIADRYISRTALLSSRPSHSTTVDQSRAWLIPDR
jgi:exoenzyme U